MSEVSLSVIVPVGPGEQAWRSLLPQLARSLPGGTEIVLVGAGDIPAETPGGWPATITLRWNLGVRGRAAQLNAGAGCASGRWLWFLHADSHLLPGCAEAVLRFIGRDAPALGWLDLAFLPDGPWALWLNALGANLRSRWLGLPFGDQGLALPAESFRSLGGFDETARYGEDHLFVWKAHHAGLPVERIGGKLATSGRRYREQGWWRTTARHVVLTVWQGWRASRGRT